ncbi:hypothetical protein FACS1894184_20210 [Clostridia bacterium]|nr:hypothetical protein FACS1894184_20210 [Clostridia bacterium]
MKIFVNAGDVAYTHEVQGYHVGELVDNYPLPVTLDELNSPEYISYLYSHEPKPFMEAALMIMKLTKWTAAFLSENIGLSSRTIERIIEGDTKNADFRTAFLIVMGLPINLSLSLFLLKPFVGNFDAWVCYDQCLYLDVLLGMHNSCVIEWNDYLEAHGVPRLDVIAGE